MRMISRYKSDPPNLTSYNLHKGNTGVTIGETIVRNPGFGPLRGPH